jgi:hypothetical protein
MKGEGEEGEKGGRRGKDGRQANHPRNTRGREGGKGEGRGEGAGGEEKAAGQPPTHATPEEERAGVIVLSPETDGKLIGVTMLWWNLLIMSN